MGQIIRPTDIKVKGPWLLDKRALEELHESLTVIESKLSEAFNIVLEKEAEDSLKKYKEFDDEMDLEKAKQKVLTRYPYNESEKNVTLVSKMRTKIQDNSLLSLLKDAQLNDFNPTTLQIQIKKGPCEFTLDVSNQYDGELETRTKVPHDEIFSDLNYEINKWIDKHQPTMATQIWSNWFFTIAFPIFLGLTLTVPWLFRSKTDIYKNKLAVESQELLKDGLTTIQEQNRAIEILLQTEIGYVPETFNPSTETNRTLGVILLLGLIALIILFIRPKTVIGLGKNTWKIPFYKKWIYFVFIFIPLTIIIPIIRSRI